MILSTAILVRRVLGVLAILAIVQASTNDIEVRVTGTVVTLDGAPAAKIVVRLRDLRGTAVSETITDEAGQFRIDRVARGRFSLEAESTGFIALPLGAKTVGGLAATIAADRDVENITVQLARTSSISGIVRDRFGSPSRSTRVTVRRKALDNDAGLTGLPLASSLTNELGQYHLDGLPPGQFVVSAMAGRAAPVAGESYAETFYPSTLDLAKATALELSGVAVDGVDINLSLLRTYSVSGSISGLGEKMSGAALWAVDLNNINGPPAEGRVIGDTFQIPSLPSGRYLIEARASVPTASSAAARWTHWSSQEIAVSAADVSDLQLVWNRTISVSGRLASGVASPMQAGSPLRAYLVESGRSVVRDVPSASTASDGTLTISGIRPGEYWLRLDLSGFWAFESLTDEANAERRYKPLRILDDGKEHSIVGSYVRGGTRVEGTLRGEDGLPTYRKAVVLFPAAPDAWDSPFTTARAMRPDTNGHFEFLDVPRGSYLLAMVDDYDKAGSRRSEFVRGLASEATRISVPTSGALIQHLTLHR